MKIIVFFLGVMLLGGSLQAEVSKKSFMKSYHKKGYEEVIISNRLGQIEVSQIEGDSIKVSAFMSVTAKTGAKADELLEYIDVNDAVTDSYINVETSFGKDMTFKQLFTGVELNVNYKISLPKGIKLSLINKEGNIYIDDFSGDLSVDVKSGNVKANTVKEGEFHIKVDNGSFNVTNVGNLVGEFKSCSLKIERGDDVKLETSSSDGRIEVVTNLTMRSSGGEMKLGEIENLSGSSSSTKYEIQDIGNVLKMDMRMGELNVRNIHFNFSTVEIKTSYTKVGLTFMEGAGYNLELKHNKSLKMDLPQSFTLNQRPTADKNVVVEAGFIGDKKYKGKVFVDVRNGNLYIQ